MYKNEVEKISTYIQAGHPLFYIQHSDLYPKNKVREIQLKGKDDKFHSPKELTEGSAYKPRCDFERFNIPLTYLSECYIPFENPDAKMFRKLFTDMDIDYHETKKNQFK